MTLRLANNNDIWLHIKDIPGLHITPVADGRASTESALLDTAHFAVVHSGGESSLQVPVDYIQVCHMHKPIGVKPGMVTYGDYHIMCVTSEE